MKQDVKARWLTALRSDEYEQTTGQLKFDGGFCCLGVLCDVVDPKGWQGDQHAGQTTFPNNAILASIDLPRGDTEEGITLLDTLCEMNDNHRLNFHSIADWIEENL